jgi:purine-binding chemotaxis protein CheW
MKHVTRKPRAASDWAEVRRRLAAISTRELSPSAATRILAERAERAARVESAQSDAAPRLECLSFSCADERYAIDSKYVLEVLKRPELTLLPGVAAEVLGLCTLRGDILPVFWIARGTARKADTGVEYAIVLGSSSPEFCVAADHVDEILRIALADVQGPIGQPLAETSERVRGVTEGALVVLDGAAMLRDSAFYLGGKRAEQPQERSP